MKANHLDHLLTRLLQLEKLVVAQAARIKEFEEALGENSGNSSKPPVIRGA